MNIIIGILLGLFVIIALLLVLLILIQDDGTEGAGIIFGSAASQQYGARKGNIVTRTTSILASLFIVFAFSLSFAFQYNSQSIEIPIDASEESKSWWDTSSSLEEEETPLEIPVSAEEDANAVQTIEVTPDPPTDSDNIEPAAGDADSTAEDATNSESVSQ